MKVNFNKLSKYTQTPVFAYCRRLIKEGIDLNTKLEIYRNNEEPDIIVSNIGKAAKLTVKEEPNLHFAKYTEKKIYNKAR